MYEFRRQPIRALYLLYEFLVTLLFLIPFWSLYYAPRSMRPRESWPLSRVIYVNLIRRLTVIVSRVGPLLSTPDHITTAKGIDIKHVWLDPVPHLVTPEMKMWAEVGDVQPISIPGYWLDKLDVDIPIGAPPMLGEKVVYALHGGAYTRMSASPTDMIANIARGLLEHCAPVQRVFAVEYRLSVAAPDPPANPFPAALLDALAGYVYLTDIVGFAPENVIIEGDSAGGNLALALTRYLIENEGMPGLPRPPGSVLLLSPWADISHSNHQPGTSSYTCLDSDYIGGADSASIKYACLAFLGMLGEEGARSNRFISPASIDVSMKPISFKGWPRTFVVAGEAELLRDQIRVLVDKMGVDMEEGHAAGQLKYYESPDSVHDFLAFSFHEPERTQTFKEIAYWVSTELLPDETYFSAIESRNSHSLCITTSVTSSGDDTG